MARQRSHKVLALKIIEDWKRKEGKALSIVQIWFLPSAKGSDIKAVTQSL